MRFAEALLELSGDSVFADAIEQSFYNAYLGSFNTERALSTQHPDKKDVPQVMPFDSYSPLVADRRGRKVGGYNIFPDGTFYGCCACIGAAGSGIMPRFALLRSKKGIVLNFYERGTINTKTPAGFNLTVTQNTAYPVDGKVKIELSLEKDEAFDIALRIPTWCTNAKVTIDGKISNADSGYYTIGRQWKNGDVIELDLPMDVQRILPPEGAENHGKFAAYKRGPIVLAADARLIDPASIIDIACNVNGIAEHNLVNCQEIKDTIECVELTRSDGENVRLVDYSSAGKTWTNDSRCAAWLYLKDPE
jgi:DUF1680 family protein